MSQTRFLVWGNNNDNLLSLAPNQCLTRPQQIIFPFKILKITATEKHISFITSNGDVYSYGSNADGRLGVGAKDSFCCLYNNPVKVKLQGKAKQIKSGFSHTCVQLENNLIYTWGLGEYGSLGVGQLRSKYLPTRVLVPTNIRSISCGAMHTSFIDFDGNMYMCGSNQYGQLGVKSPDKIGTPLLIPFPSKVKQVACGVFYTLVLTEDGDVFGMGNNKYAQLGLGHKINESKPTLIHELTNIVKVQAGYHSGALNSICELFLWGCGSFGQLLRPKKIVLSCPLSNLQIRGFFGIAISQSQNRLFIWGNNTHGQLGNGGYISYKTPTQMRDLSERRINKICCGVNFAIAIIDDEYRRRNYYQPRAIEESRKIADDRKSLGNYQSQLSTGRKRIEYRQQVNQRFQETSSHRSRRPQGSNLSHSPIHRVSSLRHYQQQQYSPQRRLPDLQSSGRGRRQEKSAQKSVHFTASNQGQRTVRLDSRDAGQNHSPHRRNYEDLFLNLSKDYEALAKRYKELQGQIQERELRRSRDNRATQTQFYLESKTSKQVQLVNQALKQQAWILEKQLITCQKELAISLQKISRQQKQLEMLSLQKEELLNKIKTQSSPPKSSIKLVETYKIQDLLKQLEEKDQTIKRLQQAKHESQRKMEEDKDFKLRKIEQEMQMRIKTIEDQKNEVITKLEEENNKISKQFNEQKCYASQIQAKYKQLSLKQSDKPKQKQISLQNPTRSESDLKMIENLKRLVIEKEDIIDRLLAEQEKFIQKWPIQQDQTNNKPQRQKRILEDKLEEEKVYSTQIQNKYRAVTKSIESIKMQNINLRESLLKSQDRISTFENEIRKMVPEKQFEAAHKQIVELKCKASQLEQKLTKSEFVLKAQASQISTLSQERVKLYKMLQEMKNLQKQLRNVGEKRLQEEREKTAKYQERVKEVEVQVKYEKEYCKKVEQKSAQMQRLRSETGKQLQRMREQMQKQKKRRKELQRQVERYKSIQKELLITRQQLQKERQLNEDFKDKVLKEYKKKDQLMKEVQKDYEEKESQLIEIVQKKQIDINRHKEELRKLGERLDGEKLQVKRLGKQINAKDQQIDNLNDENQKLERKLKHTKEQIEKELTERQQLTEQIGTLKRDQTKTTLEKQELQKRLLELEKDFREIQNSLKRQKANKTQVQNQLAELQRTLTEIKQQNSYMRSQLDQATLAVEQANKISDELSSANKQFAENEQNLNKKVQQLEAKVYELEDQIRSYSPRYEALLERNRELDERNNQLSDMVNKAIQIQAQSYKQSILKEVEMSTNQIINEVQDQKVYKQRFSRKPVQNQENLSHESQNEEGSLDQHGEVVSRVKEEPYTKYMNQKIECHRRRVSESAQKLAGILDLDSGLGSSYSKRLDPVSRKASNDQNYERINSHMDSLKTQKEAFMSKINSFAEKMKLL